MGFLNEFSKVGFVENYGLTKPFPHCVDYESVCASFEIGFCGFVKNNFSVPWKETDNSSWQIFLCFKNTNDPDFSWEKRIEKKEGNSRIKVLKCNTFAALKIWNFRLFGGQP